jgi:hypothetical protein
MAFLRAGGSSAPKCSRARHAKHTSALRSTARTAPWCAFVDSAALERGPVPLAATGPRSNSTGSAFARAAGLDTCRLPSIQRCGCCRAPRLSSENGSRSSRSLRLRRLSRPRRPSRLRPILSRSDVYQRNASPESRRPRLDRARCSRRATIRLWHPRTNSQNCSDC